MRPRLVVDGQLNVVDESRRCLDTDDVLATWHCWTFCLYLNIQVRLARLQVRLHLPLASIIIDALLCILVDPVPSLRVLKDGIQVVARILKQAGTP